MCCFFKFQPIMALFRPGPKDKNRPIFNWAHWAVGMAAHILGGEIQVLCNTDPMIKDTKYHYNLHFIEACKRIMWCNYLIQKNLIIYFLLQLSRYVLVWSYKKLALLNTQCML